MNHLILDRVTEIVLHDRRAALQKEALELTSYIKQNQDVTHTLVNICQRYVRSVSLRIHAHVIYRDF